MAPINRIRNRLEKGEVAMGARVKTHAPALIEVYGQLALDFVWIDFEHGGPSPEHAGYIEGLIRAADSAEIDLLVRLPTGAPHVVRKQLDAGVRTVLIPRVDGPEDIRPAVEAAYFTYEGEPGQRGFAGGRVSGWGNHADTYAEDEDASVLIGAQIESQAGIDHLDEILAIPGLGFINIGHGDLAVSLGHPLNPGHAEVQGAIDSVRRACHAAGVPIGRIPADVDDAVDAMDAGYQLLRLGDEIEGARQLLGNRLDALRER